MLRVVPLRNSVMAALSPFLPRPGIFCEFLGHLSTWLTGGTQIAKRLGRLQKDDVVDKRSAQGLEYELCIAHPVAVFQKVWAAPAHPIEFRI
jgi:hypothetical protein